MDKLHPRAVIFDLGSTLIEYETIPWPQMNVYCANRAREFLVQQGYDIPAPDEFHRVYENVKERYRERAAQTLVEWTVLQAAADLLKEWNIEADHDLLDRFFEAYYQPVGDKIYAYDDTVPTLERVKRTYPMVGLISNTVFPEHAHRRELKRFGIEPYLDFVVFSSSFGWRKPHAAIFYKAANLAGYAPSECVYIGDRYIEDVEGPSAVGMSAILKLWEKREYPKDVLAPIRTIRSLAELDAHLDFGG